MYKKFSELSKVVQIILLVIPLVSMVAEILIRADLYNAEKKPGDLVMLLLNIITGGTVGIIDAIMIAVNGNLLRF